LFRTSVQVVIDANARKLKCLVLAEGAGGPTTNEADPIIEERADRDLIPGVAP
jgi:glutamate dehydrogenase (NAD(P)+)